MKRFIIILCMLLPILAMAQKDSVVAGVYDRKEPLSKSSYGSSAILFEGKTIDMEWMQMSTNTMQFSNEKKRYESKVPDKEENLILMKSGVMGLHIGDSSYSISAGSLVLLLPGQTYSYRSENGISCSYYKLRYRSKLPADTARGKTSGGSVVKDWNNVEFKPNEKGGRRSFLERPTAMCRRLEIHATTLKEGLKSHVPHTHKAAEFTLVTESKTEMQIGDATYKGEAGSIYYAPSNVLHALQNTGVGNCTYFAIQFE